MSAPAKVNLNLRILHRRPDGFHELETVMAPISLCDELEVQLTTDGRVTFTCSEPALPTDDNNLVVKALNLFSRETGTPAGYRVHLTKRIPSGAGLGGGSSDAAHALMMADALHHTQLGKPGLTEMAAGLGSDVPFFLYGKPALCRGRGERIEPWSGQFPAWIVLVKPPFGVSTPWAYQTFARQREIRPQAPPAERPKNGNVNDLEDAVFSKYLVLKALKQWLAEQEGIGWSLMSGSGATVFGVPQDGMENGVQAFLEVLRQDVGKEFGESFWVGAAEVISGRERG